MRALLRKVALATSLALCASFALAQSGTGPIPNSTNAGAFGPAQQNFGSHIIWGGGPPPSLNAACGTAPSVVVGTDSAFTFTSGTSTGATCTATFATPWNTAPSCSLDNQTNGGTAYAVSPTGLVISGVADSTKYQILCIGHPGG